MKKFIFLILSFYNIYGLDDGGLSLGGGGGVTWTDQQTTQNTAPTLQDKCAFLSNYEKLPTLPTLPQNITDVTDFINTIVNPSIQNINNTITNFKSDVSNWQNNLTKNDSDIDSLNTAISNFNNSATAYKTAKNCTGNNCPSLITAINNYWSTASALMAILNKWISTVPAPAALTAIPNTDPAIYSLSNFDGSYFSKDNITAAIKAILTSKYNDCYNKIKKIANNLTTLANNIPSFLQQAKKLVYAATDEQNQRDQIDNLIISSTSQLVNLGLGIAFDPVGTTFIVVTQTLLNFVPDYTNDPEVQGLNEMNKKITAITNTEFGKSKDAIEKTAQDTITILSDAGITVVSDPGKALLSDSATAIKHGAIGVADTIASQTISISKKVISFFDNW